MREVVVVEVVLVPAAANVSPAVRIVEENTCLSICDSIVQRAVHHAKLVREHVLWELGKEAGLFRRRCTGFESRKCRVLSGHDLGLWV